VVTLANPEEAQVLASRITAQGHAREIETRIHLGSGESRVLLYSAEVIELDGVPCVIAVALDITERKRAEEELLRALARERELSRLKSDFVSLVSHEFRTPLGIISSSADLLERYYQRLNEAERREQLHSIQQCAQRMAATMEDVLLSAKVEAGRLEFHPVPFDLRSLCHRVANEVESATGQRCPIHCRMTGINQPFTGDESLLHHILSNLLSNAVKYSPDRAPVTLHLVLNQTGTSIRVSDRGVGIPASDQERLFNAFHRGRNVRHLPGTGLGLVIVKRCVELHGGKIEFTSTEAVGTTFTVSFSLPAKPPGDSTTRRARARIQKLSEVSPGRVTPPV
jgi:signal transduction histidine kinase